jgi:hypothetical protein
VIFLIIFYLFSFFLFRIHQKFVSELTIFISCLVAEGTPCKPNPTNFVPINFLYARMEPCHPKNNYYCVYYLLKESKDALLHTFKQDGTVGLQKQFVYGMLSSSSNDDGFLRCFKVTKNIFLCHEGLLTVLQLSCSKKQSIVPSSKLIGKRYHLVCISEIFNALALYYRTSLIQLCIYLLFR